MFFLYFCELKIILKKLYLNFVCSKLNHGIIY